MPNFVLLYTGGGMPETEAEIAVVMQQWMAWYGKLGDAVVDGGNPIGPVAKTISGDGTVSDTPMSAMSPSGYSIIKADSLNEAVSLASDCPILGGHDGMVHVYETFAAM